MIRLLPYENITLSTRLSVQEVLKSLENTIGPKQSLGDKLLFLMPSMPYNGEIKGLTFRAQRSINYKNSFLPEISGTINAAEEGSIIVVKMRLYSLSMIFMCFWLGLVGLMCAAVAFVIVFKQSFEVAMLAPFAFFLFGYALAVGGFSCEAEKSKNDFLRILAAETIK